ncbi:MAG: enoyl-CoA hydratase/carnithine racemase-like [Phormidium phage MIS-PhV1B]|jgi:Orthopoxvirus protein of unknown function (DUF830).|uniref:enoyl-CoA hydratase/carnithine racemase-like n=1 Tax=Phormidium phage MIS-PhV1B TaxID=1391456 RepID=UPI0003C9C9EB|nr:MAG: enoyl-CoA hydratase/carnithine racemase-like [Phormidium phage MIS-PhV1B]AGZ61835.1 MAG: hypothetical protein [Phormidium phage MIS-PhV1B]
MLIVTEAHDFDPVYGSNYKPGYIGFTNRDSSIVSIGIAYFTGWNLMNDIHVTHAFIVLDENTCIEADTTNNSVEKSSLKKYFDDPECQIFFRKPIDFTEKIGDAIALTALGEVGKQYDFGAILTQALSGSLAGRILDRIFRGKFEDKIAEILQESDKWVCSELVAYALDEQPIYRDRGILSRPNSAISPQELFEDSQIFTPWKNQK